MPFYILESEPFNRTKLSYGQYPSRIHKTNLKGPITISDSNKFLLKYVLTCSRNETEPCLTRAFNGVPIYFTGI